MRDQAFRGTGSEQFARLSALRHRSEHSCQHTSTSPNKLRLGNLLRLVDYRLGIEELQIAVRQLLQVLLQDNVPMLGDEADAILLQRGKQKYVRSCRDSNPRSF